MKAPRSCSFPAPHAWTGVTIEMRTDKGFCTFGLCWLCLFSCCPGNLSAAPPCSCCNKKHILLFQTSKLIFQIPIEQICGSTCVLCGSAWAIWRLAEECSLESLPVLGAHQVVEDGVEGGGEEVEAAGEVEEVLVHRPEVLVLSEVHITQSLEVERCPRDKEENNH